MPELQLQEPTELETEPASDDAIDDVLDDDLLVEEVSIDGMCGVY